MDYNFFGQMEEKTKKTNYGMLVVALVIVVVIGALALLILSASSEKVSIDAEIKSMEQKMQSEKQDYDNALAMQAELTRLTDDRLFLEKFDTAVQKSHTSRDEVITTMSEQVPMGLNIGSFAIENNVMTLTGMCIEKRLVGDFVYNLSLRNDMFISPMFSTVAAEGTFLVDSATGEKVEGSDYMGYTFVIEVTLVERDLAQAADPGTVEEQPTPSPTDDATDASSQSGVG